MGKYKCNKCEFDNEFQYSKTKVSSAGVVSYWDKSNNHLKCLKCGSEELSFICEVKQFTQNFNMFNIKTPEQKKELLQKRAKEHSQKASQVEQRRNFDKNFGGKIDTSFY